MKFVKKIRDNQIQFSVANTEDNMVSVEFIIPPYGSYKRGEQYFITELNQLVLQEIDQDLIPVKTQGRCKALQKETKTVYLSYNTIVKSKNVKDDSMNTSEDVLEEASEEITKKTTTSRSYGKKNQGSKSSRSKKR